MNKIMEKDGREDYDIKEGFDAAHVDSVYTRWVSAQILYGVHGHLYCGVFVPLNPLSDHSIYI